MRWWNVVNGVFSSVRVTVRKHLSDGKEKPSTSKNYYTDTHLNKNKQYLL